MRRMVRYNKRLTIKCLPQFLVEPTEVVPMFFHHISRRGPPIAFRGNTNIAIVIHLRSNPAFIRRPPDPKHQICP